MCLSGARPKGMSGLNPFSDNECFKAAHRPAVGIQNHLSQRGDTQSNVLALRAMDNDIGFFLEKKYRTIVHKKVKFFMKKIPAPQKTWNFSCRR